MNITKFNLMSKKKKIIFWLFVGGLIILGLGGYFLKRKKAAVEYVTETVTRGDLLKEVSVTGKILSKEEVNLNFETAGRIKEIKASVGQEVVKGEVLATIEDEILAKEVEKARLTWEKILAENGTSTDAIREAEQTVKNAEKYLEEIKKLDKEKEASAEQALEAAKKYYNDALVYYEQVVADQGINSSQAKSAKMTLTTAENNRDSAEKNLKVVKKTSDVNQVSAQGTLSSAKDKLRTVQSEYAQKSRNAAVASAKITYEQAVSNWEKASLKAPVNGLITKINYRRGEMLGTASLNNSFGKMIAEDFVLEADIPESDITKIQLGQSAEISFDSLDTEEKFFAQVIEIEPSATVMQEVVYYKVKLSLEKYDSRLKEGMSFDADIKVFRKENVLMIPKRALIGGGESVRVLLSDGFSTQERKIEKGVEGNDGLIEVLKGLEEGEKVVVLEKNN